MNLPTVNTLIRIKGITADQARGVRNTLEAFRIGAINLDKCLTRADELIGGHGVEYIRHAEDSMRECKGIEYVNLGDTYDCTLCFDHTKCRFYVCSWGGIVESAPEGSYP
jgi:hypothetical protein